MGIKCDRCGAANALLLTRMNEKGIPGIFHCDVCLGKPVDDTGEALRQAIEDCIPEPQEPQLNGGW